MSLGRGENVHSASFASATVHLDLWILHLPPVHSATCNSERKIGNRGTIKARSHKMGPSSRSACSLASQGNIWNEATW